MIEIIDDIAPRPIMLVGGGVPKPFTGSEGDHLQSYLHYAGENAELWVIPEAYHCDGPRRKTGRVCHANGRILRYSF